MSFKLILTMILAYNWPISPVNQQHNISGTFGEFRHTFSIHYHNGVDIPAPEGTPVYAVLGGEVLWMESGFNGGIRVGRFAYIHVVPRSDLQLGDHVNQGEVVGYINEGAHVHFKDGGGASSYPVRNPLMPDALQPFDDPWGTNVYRVAFFSHYLDRQMNPDSLWGWVDIVAGALDTTGYGQIAQNNGIFAIWYEVLTSDTDSVVVGPHQLVRFEYLPSTPVEEVYYIPWSSNQSHNYIVTNSASKSVGYLNLNRLPGGDYVLAVYATDTRENYDTNFVRIHVLPPDTTPPQVPVLKNLKLLDDGRAMLTWQRDTVDVAGYKLYLNFNHYGWNEWATLSPSDTSFTTSHPLVNNWDFYFKLVAYDNMGNYSDSSTTYVVRRTNSPDRVLIVDGNDRERGNDYFETYLTGIENITVETASWRSLPDLSNYKLVIWSSGSDTTDIDTAALESFISNGGKLFINGANIAKKYMDTGFLRSLGAVFVSDSTTNDTVESRPCGPFYDLSSVIINGLESDVIDTVSGGFAIMRFRGDGTAGVLSPDSNAIFFSFSTDHASNDSFKIGVLQRLISFFGVTEVSEGFDSVDEAFKLRFSITGNVYTNAKKPEILNIYDPAGRLIKTLRIEPGSRNYSLNLGSGVYFYRVKNGRVGRFLIVK